MKKLKILRYTSFALSILCMAVIFWFSAQNARNSSEISENFTKTLFNTSDNIFIQSMQFAVRKSAHFIIYAVLGTLVSLTVLSFNLGKFRCFMLSQCICTLYAISDEIHQLFSEGRSCELRDAAIDSWGAALGISITVFMLGKFLMKFRKFSQNP